MKSTHKQFSRPIGSLTPRIIKNEADYRASLARIDSIFNAKPGTPEGDELELLAFLVEDYEDRRHPIDQPDPIVALRFRMDQAGLRPSDLIPYIGSKGRVSDVLSRRRPLSLTMIRKLVAGLGIPADVALRESRLTAR